MLEQEIASVMSFVIDKADNPAPYYWNIPQDFVVPAVYFPQTEIVSGADTLSSYTLDYSLFVKFFAKDTQSAHAMGSAVLTAIKSIKNDIPLIDENGESTGRIVRMDDPVLRPTGDMAAQLTLMWTSHRPYYEKAFTKMETFEINLFLKNSFDNAVVNYNNNRR